MFTCFPHVTTEPPSSSRRCARAIFWITDIDLSLLWSTWFWLVGYSTFGTFCHISRCTANKDHPLVRAMCWMKRGWYRHYSFVCILCVDKYFVICLGIVVPVQEIRLRQRSRWMAKSWLGYQGPPTYLPARTHFVCTLDKRRTYVLVGATGQQSYFLGLFGDRCNVLGPKCLTFWIIVRIDI